MVRRIVVIETLDNGFVVRSAGDIGKTARAFDVYTDLEQFVRWLLTDAPDLRTPGENLSFPLLPALEDPSTALEPKEGHVPRPPRRKKKPTDSDTYQPTDSFRTMTTNGNHDATTKRMDIASAADEVVDGSIHKPE